MKNPFAILLLILFSLPAISQDLSGNWIGELNINGSKLGFAFAIVKTEGQYQATMDIPKQGLNGAKAESVTVTDTMFTLSFPTYKLAYQGSLKQDRIVGKLYKGDSPVPLNLTRGVFVVNRPQEPKAPFYYHSEDVTFSNASNLKLAATLTTPKKGGEFPVAIIISGSGPHNRDGEMFGHKPYYVLAHELTTKGIAVLRYDERGVGNSEGNFETADIENLSADVSSAIAYLKTRKDIDPKKIGLIGHSIGGIIAPKVASEDKSVNFLVLLAAPGINGDKLMISQKAALERVMGLDEFQIAQGRQLVKGAYDIITGTEIEGLALKDSLDSYYIQRYGNLLPEGQRKTLIQQITGRETISLIRSKPAEYLEKIKCPVLALNGSKDFQVPATENLAAIQNSIQKNGNKELKIVELADLNHLFQESNKGISSEYAEIEQTISPAVLELITDWVLAQVK